MMTPGEKMVWAAVFAQCMQTDDRGISRMTAREAGKRASTAVNELRFGCADDAFWREMTGFE